MNYLPDEITFAHISILKSGAGYVCAGIELSKRKTAEDGRLDYALYHVMSQYYGGDEPRSLRQTIPVIAADILRFVDPETNLLILRSNVPNFRQWRYYEGLINVFAAATGVKVKINHDMRVIRRFPDTVRLAIDAERRGLSLNCAI